MKPRERSKKKRFVRTPGGKNKRVAFKGKSGKHSCALCGRVMHGMPHGKRRAQVRKLAGSERSSSGMFSGTLCNKCRAVVIEEAVKVGKGLKDARDVGLGLKPFTEVVERRVE